MKKAISLLLALVLCLSFFGCSKAKDYVLTEDTFFLVMTNMQYYPEQYVDSKIEFDCFTYDLVDVDGVSHLCGVRKCSSGYGCTCGNDTIIGFVLDYDGELPAPRNQSANDGDKTWVHLTGRLRDANKETITIPAYLPDGSVNPDTTEQILFLVFEVEECREIEDTSGLNYYVTK